MNIIRNTGIDISEADGEPLLSGQYYYWNADMANILLQETHGVMPSATYTPANENAYTTRFFMDDRHGYELCSHSQSLTDPTIRLPEKDVDALIAALDQLHQKSENPKVPQDSRQFMRDFKVPHPLKMKESWRVSNGLTRQLVVLWGYSQGHEASILPLTPTSLHWTDKDSRVDLKKLLRENGLLCTGKANWGKLICYTLLVLLALTLLGLLVWCGVHYLNSERAGGDNAPYATTMAPQALEQTAHEKAEPSADHNGHDSTGQRASAQSEAPYETSQDGQTFMSPTPSQSDRSEQRDIEPEQQTQEAAQPEQAEQQTQEAAQPEQPPQGEAQPEQAAQPAPPANPEQKHVKAEPIRSCAFKVVLRQVSDREQDEEEKDALFALVPETEHPERVEFTVLNWEVNGDVKASGTNTREFSLQKLSIRRRMTITAEVSMYGERQPVTPYQWNCIDRPVWMLERDGKEDGRYKVVCTNSSNIAYQVTHWEIPVFRNQLHEDISGKFNVVENTQVKPHGVLLRWEQKHLGEYLLELKAKVEILPGHGHKGGETMVSGTFPMLNGSIGQSLISLKLGKAKERIYCCLTQWEDGSLGNGTAVAVSDKLLLTNYHVAVGNIPEYYGGDDRKVDSGRPLRLVNQTASLYAKVVKADRKSDLALLRLCDAQGHDTDAIMPTFYKIAESDPPKDGRTFSLGYPSGTTPAGEPQYVNGKVEALHDVNEERRYVLHFSNIQPGYSGGPLVLEDRDSEIIGLNCSGLQTDSPLKQGVNWAISAKSIRQVFPELFTARQ